MFVVFVSFLIISLIFVTGALVATWVVANELADDCRRALHKRRARHRNREQSRNWTRRQK